MLYRLESTGPVGVTISVDFSRSDEDESLISVGVMKTKVDWTSRAERRGRGEEENLRRRSSRAERRGRGEEEDLRRRSEVAN
ncbi:hypothetical protein U1Q18_015086 [Sarracenia purpurea var. burkii]